MPLLRLSSRPRRASVLTVLATVSGWCAAATLPAQVLGAARATCDQAVGQTVASDERWRIFRTEQPEAGRGGISTFIVCRRTASPVRRVRTFESSSGVGSIAGDLAILARNSGGVGLVNLSTGAELALQQEPEGDGDLHIQDARWLLADGALVEQQTRVEFGKHRAAGEVVATGVDGSRVVIPGVHFDPGPVPTTTPDAPGATGIAPSGDDPARGSGFYYTDAEGTPRWRGVAGPARQAGWTIAADLEWTRRSFPRPPGATRLTVLATSTQNALELERSKGRRSAALRLISRQPRRDGRGEYREVLGRLAPRSAGDVTVAGFAQATIPAVIARFASAPTELRLRLPAGGGGLDVPVDPTTRLAGRHVVSSQGSVAVADQAGVQIWEVVPGPTPWRSFRPRVIAAPGAHDLAVGSIGIQNLDAITVLYFTTADGVPHATALQES